MAKKKTCGIIMPISECDGLGASHWGDVRKIVESVASEAGFETRLVSDTFESNLIHKEILQNIYNDDLIICDVSGRNPNVFFELGIRMATQKPTVIIKDEVTSYPFDTGPNRYIQYPRDMRHPVMEKFKKDLTAAIDKTSKQPKENSFIGQLGPFHIPDVESASVPATDVILERMNFLERSVTRIGQMVANESQNFRSVTPESTIEVIRSHEDNWSLILNGFSPKQVIDLKAILANRLELEEIDSVSSGPHEHQIFITGTNLNDPKTSRLIQNIAGSFSSRGTSVQ